MAKIIQALESSPTKAPFFNPLWIVYLLFDDVINDILIPPLKELENSVGSMDYTIFETSHGMSNEMMASSSSKFLLARIHALQKEVSNKLRSFQNQGETLRELRRKARTGSSTMSTAHQQQPSQSLTHSKDGDSQSFRNFSDRINLRRRSSQFVQGETPSSPNLFRSPNYVIQSGTARSTDSTLSAMLSNKEFFLDWPEVGIYFDNMLVSARLYFDGFQLFF